MLLDYPDRLVHGTHDLIHIVLLNAAFENLPIGVDDDRHASMHLHRPALITAHSSGSGGEQDTVLEVAVIVFDGYGGQGLERAFYVPMYSHGAAVY